MLKITADSWNENTFIGLSFHGDERFEAWEKAFDEEVQNRFESLRTVIHERINDSAVKAKMELKKQAKKAIKCLR